MLQGKTKYKGVPMFNFFLKKTDSEIQRDIINEVNWDLMISATQFGVGVKDGIVTLTGSVPRYLERSQIADAAQRVTGVRSIANLIKVAIAVQDIRSDEQITTAALNAIRGSYTVPTDIKASVKKGWITLSGEATWDSQRKTAKTVVGQVKGVSGVTNNIAIRAS